MVVILNKEQLDGLAKLCFDLAKGGFALAVLAPATSSSLATFISGLRGLLIGLALTYLALILLRLKEQIV